MSALCSVSVLQHFFLPDFPSRGAEEPAAEGDAVERGRFIGKAGFQKQQSFVDIRGWLSKAQSFGYKSNKWILV